MTRAMPDDLWRDFPKTATEFEARFATEEDCRAYWIEARWGGSPVNVTLFSDVPGGTAWGEVPLSDLSNCSSVREQNMWLLDHLAGPSKQGGRYTEAQGLGRLL